MLPQIAKRRSCRCINYKQYTNNYTLDIEAEKGSASNRSKAILGPDITEMAPDELESRPC